MKAKAKAKAKSKSCPKCGENCYAKLLNGAGDGKKVYREDEFCHKCEAHLSASGICLNACHLSDASRARFGKLLSLCAKSVEEKKV